MEIGALPRGEIISRGNVGEYPKGSARPISVLGQGSPIAISERQGRSPKIVYRDPLTDALAEGWLWAGSAELLDDGSGAITRRRKRRASRKPIFDDVIMVQEFGRRGTETCVHLARFYEHLDLSNLKSKLAKPEGLGGWTGDWE